MQISEIRTARLRLVAVTPEMLDLQQTNPQALGRILEASVPFGWPGSDWEPHVYCFFRAQFRDSPGTIGWHRYMISSTGEETVLIGSLGAHPKEADEAEIGYGVLESWQGKGFATEAVRALLHFLFDLGLRRIRAQTFPENAPSVRVLQKCGLKPAGNGEEAGAVCYAIERERFLKLPRDESGQDSCV